MNIRTLLFWVIFAVVAYGGWRFYNSDTARVQRTLRAAAKTIEKNGSEGVINEAVAAQRGAGYFAPVATFDIKGLHQGEATREDIKTAIAFARSRVSTLALTLRDINVMFSPDGKAQVGLTARMQASSTSDNEDSFQEFSLTMARSSEGGLWQIERLQSVETVHWPGTH